MTLLTAPQVNKDARAFLAAVSVAPDVLELRNLEPAIELGSGSSKVQRAAVRQTKTRLCQEAFMVVAQRGA
jgi:hypothetical protein